MTEPILCCECEAELTEEEIKNSEGCDPTCQKCCDRITAEESQIYYDSIRIRRL